jgi:hypothetical protein
MTENSYWKGFLKGMASVLDINPPTNYLSSPIYSQTDLTPQEKDALTGSK